jgi:hypothetical protein
MKLTLFLLALVLAGGLAVWLGRTNTGPGRRPVGPAPAAQPSNPAGDNAKLEAETAARKSESSPTAQPAGREAGAAPAQPLAPPQPVDPSVIASGLDGGTPSDVASTADTSAFEAKYANATKAELKASYDAMKVLYDENVEGRVQDKDRLTPEGLAELAREVAWLKDKAFGGA